jgi:hypothetical protein
MKVISFIKDDALIKKILMHLGLWDTRNHKYGSVSDHTNENKGGESEK